MNFNRLASACSVCLAFVALAGCGSSNEFPRAAVRGMVLLDGEPLPEGIIRFVPTGATKGPKSFAEIRVGMFKVDEQYGPIVGTHRIEIISTDDGGFPDDDEEAFKRMQEQGITKIDKITVPAAYNKRSQLTESVSPEGPNDFKFELSSNPQQKKN